MVKYSRRRNKYKRSKRHSRHRRALALRRSSVHSKRKKYNKTHSNKFASQSSPQANAVHHANMSQAATAVSASLRRA
jgi:hypothetical protein